jgi:hypothetical protein
VAERIGRVPEGDATGVPDSATTQRRAGVAQPLADDLSLELDERGEQVEH